MHSIKIHRVIALIVSLFYFVGFWHRGNTPTIREQRRVKLFYIVYYCMFIVSFIVGAITSTKLDVTIFLTEASIATGVYMIKLWILISKQREILILLNRICEFSIRDDDSYALFRDKIVDFIRFVTVFVMLCITGGSLACVVVPLFGSEKTLFFEIGFPLDWRNSEIAFWIATIFIFTEVLMTIVIAFFSIIIWYLLLNCSLRYKILGCQLKKMGQSTQIAKVKVSEFQKHKHLFFNSLTESVDTYAHLREVTDEMGSFFGNIFFVKICTFSLLICGCTFCLAFDMADTLLERFTYLLALLFFIADLFMLTYFGNEIMLSSDQLTYSLFESDWYNQPQSTKKCILIFCEYLKQPQVIVIGKLYPLTLETFTRIINSAYSMFNILKSFK